MCIDPTGIFGAQECNYASDVFRQTNSPQCSMRGDHFVYFRIVTNYTALDIGFNCSRSYSICPDATSAQLFREVMRVFLNRHDQIVETAEKRSGPFVMRVRAYGSFEEIDLNEAP